MSSLVDDVRPLPVYGRSANDETLTPLESVMVQRGERASGRTRGAWKCARTDGENALLVVYMGSPRGFPRGGPPLYVGTAREAGGALLVSVSPRPELVPQLRRGRAAGRVGVIRVEVAGGWRGREILDAADGRPRAVFDRAALLRPPGGPGEGRTVIENGDDRPSWWQLCPLSGTAGVSVVHTDAGPVDGWPPVPGTPQGTVAVRGRAGEVVEERDGRRVVTRTLWWSERGAVVSVRSSAPGGPGEPGDRDVLGVGELVSFANSLE